MVKKLLLASFILVSLSLFVSCDNSTGGNSSEGKIKAAMTVDGVLMDGAMNQLALEGLKRAQNELDYKISYQSIPQASDYDSSLETIYQEDNDIILVVGYRMWEAMQRQAESHPDQKYAIVDFTQIDNLSDNVLAIGFKSEQGSFLAGYLAAKMSQTNKIGFVGGIAGTIIDMFDYGYEAGAKYANPNIEVVKQYAESFGDPAKGKSIATHMYQNGVDVIFQAAGATGLGVIESAKEMRGQGKDIWVIGVDVDQAPLAPEAVLVSVLKKVDNTNYLILETLKNGQWDGGSIVEFGLNDGAIALSESPYIPFDLSLEIDSLSQKIVNEEIVVPYDSKSMIQFSRNYLSK